MFVFITDRVRLCSIFGHHYMIIFFLLDCHVSCLLNLGLFQEVLIKAGFYSHSCNHFLISSAEWAVVKHGTSLFNLRLM